MPKEPKDKPTQQTQPRGDGPPIEIPVPKRNDVLGDAPEGRPARLNSS